MSLRGLFYRVSDRVQASIRARLFETERGARRRAEEARDRTRRLQRLTEMLSGAPDQNAVMHLMVSAGREALDASAGFAWLLRDTELELAASEHDGLPPHLMDFVRFPLDARLPVCDSVRDGKPRMFDDVAALQSEYPDAVLPDGSCFRAWAVVPFFVGGEPAGAVAFTFGAQRRFGDDEREHLSAVVGQASIALERCRLFESERRARQRERQLRVLAARLSSALTPPEVAEIACEEAISVLGAFTGATAIKAGNEVRILGTGGLRDDEALSRVAVVDLDADIPIAESLRRSELVWCPSRSMLAERYAELEPVWGKLGIRAWGAVPFKFQDEAVGSLAISFREERVLDAGEREFLFGVGQLTAQALERARLYEAHRASEEQLRVALSAAHAGTWSLDLKTMRSTRDPSYREVTATNDEYGIADFSSIHPEDRDLARRQFERALREGTPYEPEVRLVRSDGSYHWIRAHGRVVAGPDGEPETLAGVVVDIDESKRARLLAEEERRINETLYRLGSSFASELEHDRLAQLITDELSALVGAELAAFVDGDGRALALHAGASATLDRARELPQQLPPSILAETLVWQRSLRLDDIFADPRRGAPDDLPRPDASMRSYLAVPVVAGSGKIFGSLLFGHSAVRKFTQSHARLASNVATQAAVALENALLYKTVVEQKEQLEAAVERAKVADRRKDEFLAMLGHELRNPLAPILSVLELMALKDHAAFEREREVIRRQVHHVTRLIDDLLDVSRITGGKIQLAKRIIQIREVLEQAVETAAPAFERRKQRLEVEVPEGDALVDADHARLAQVFQNLLDNAGKYSDAHATVKLSARTEGEFVLVEVSDQGAGIDTELLPRIFELFVQGKRTLDRAQGGLGIGLAIVHSLCELHGATITPYSAGLGRGSTFTVKLPRAEPRAADRQSDAPPSHSRPIARRVLVVDDNADAAEMMHELLASAGHETALAFDAATALEVAGSFKPDVALLDIGLPGMDGYELARRLRNEPGLEALYLIAVTGYGQDSDRALARAAGFDHHLVKPVGFEKLAPLLSESAAHRPRSNAR